MRVRVQLTVLIVGTDRKCTEMSADIGAGTILLLLPISTLFMTLDSSVTLYFERSL